MCEHVFGRYILVDSLNETFKVFTEKNTLPGTFYVGYECECGEQGYQIPA